MALSEKERVLRARLGAYSLHATHDPKETTQAGRAAFFRRFLDEVDPKQELSDPERLRRALAARRAFMTRLALRSAIARSRRAGRR